MHVGTFIVWVLGLVGLFVPLGLAVWLILAYPPDGQDAGVSAEDGALEEVRAEMASLRRRMADVGERLADVMVLVDDVAKSALPDPHGRDG